MTSLLERSIEKALVHLATSDDPNDWALCASMAAILAHWRHGQACVFLDCVRRVENRQAVALGEMNRAQLN